MVSFIGKNIDIARSDITLDGSRQHTPARLALADDASQITISIKDDSGKIVRTIEMGRNEAGEVDLEWDGLADDGSPLEEGNYTISVQALNEEGDRVDTQVITKRRVSGVSFEQGLPRLELEGLEDQPASLGEVQQVTQEG